MMSDAFKAGAAQREISPAPGDALSGFIARLSPATGVAEPLCVRAAAFAQGAARCAVIQADVLGFAPWQVTEVREFAATRLGMARENLMLSATHTHSGPSLIAVRGALMASREYQDFVVSQMQSALEEAVGNCAPAALATGRFPIEFGINRREETPDGVQLGIAYDKARPRHVEVAQFSMEGRSILLFSHACHPYILGAENLLASGDFPSFAAHSLESDGKTTALFLNGCAGDIAPLAAFQGIAAARREGERLADAVRQACAGLLPQKPLGIGGEHQVIRLPHAALPSEEEITAIAIKQEKVVRPEERQNPEVQQRLRAATREWSERMRGVVSLQQPMIPLHCEVQALRLGTLTLLGISGEPFFEIGERLRAPMPHSNIWPLGFTNAYCGYIATRSEIAGGGYEVEDAWKCIGDWRLDETAEERVMEAARCVLARLESTAASG